MYMLLLPERYIYLNKNCNFNSLSFTEKKKKKQTALLLLSRCVRPGGGTAESAWYSTFLYWLLHIPGAGGRMWCSGQLGFGVWLIGFATPDTYSIPLCLSLSTCKMGMIVSTHDIEEIRWDNACEALDTWHRPGKYFVTIIAIVAIT